MNKFILTISVLLSASGLFAVESAPIRVDTRMESGAIGGVLATGVEAVGETDGTTPSSWDTTALVWDAAAEDYTAKYPDGWYVREARDSYAALAEGETPDHDMLVINSILVVGGRMTTNETWSAEAMHIVRHNVVIPAGVELVIEAEAPVKLTENARFVVEEGGSLAMRGAFLAEITDDEWVGGDTNLDGTNTVASGTEDWIAGMDAGDYVHVKMMDGAERIFPTRSYTRGEVYGVLPTVDRYEDGWFFRGWVTNLADSVGVEADQLAEMDERALYCNWEAIYLNLSTGLVEFAAYSVGEEHALGVDSNDAWIFSCEDDWVHVETNETGLVVTADQNRSESARSAVIVVSRANGKLEREVSVVQAAMGHVAQPRIYSADGETTFSDYDLPVRISTTTAGATIYYTTDGSEPSAENGLIPDDLWTEDDGTVIGEILVYGSTTVKAIAVKTELLDSTVTSVRFVHESSLAEAMDLDAEQVVNTDGTAGWVVAYDEAVEGATSARSGEMTRSNSQRRYSNLTTFFSGKGVLTFSWKASCYTDGRGKYGYDYLAFSDSDGHFKYIDGETGWQQVRIEYSSDTIHTLKWTFSLVNGFSDRNGGYRNCGWVDNVVWTPALFTVGSDGEERVAYVSADWMTRLGIVGALEGDDAAEAAVANDADGDGYSNEEEYILGTDPLDANSRLLTTIKSEDGLMKIDFTPVNNAGEYALTYRIMGASELKGGETVWKDVTDMSEAERDYMGFKFFKTTVEVGEK